MKIQQPDLVQKLKKNTNLEARSMDYIVARTDNIFHASVFRKSVLILKIKTPEAKVDLFKTQEFHIKGTFRESLYFHRKKT